MTIIANKYKITGILGDGTFGKVFKAENILTKNNVAKKSKKKKRAEFEI